MLLLDVLKLLNLTVASSDLRTLWAYYSLAISQIELISLRSTYFFVILTEKTSFYLPPLGFTGNRIRAM